MLAWVEQGTPLGDPKDLPPPRTFPEGWAIGTPDVVFELPEPQTVAAQGTLPYVHVRVPTHFKEDMWVQAAEAQPGDRAVVHHILVFVDDQAASGGRGSGVSSPPMRPGDAPTVLPPALPRRSRPAPTWFSRSTTRRSARSAPTARGSASSSPRGRSSTRRLPSESPSAGFIIPPGATTTRSARRSRSPRDAHLLDLMPHMHLRGKSFEYKATYPDGSSEVLLSVPAFDFGWQSSYLLATPKAMPKGTRIDCLAHYDNSAEQPANPDPKRAVTWGDQTWEEMMIGYIVYVDDEPVSARTSQAPARAEGGNALRPAVAFASIRAQFRSRTRCAARGMSQPPSRATLMHAGWRGEHSTRRVVGG